MFQLCRNNVGNEPFTMDKVAIRNMDLHAENFAVPETISRRSRTLSTRPLSLPEVSKRSVDFTIAALALFLLLPLLIIVALAIKLDSRGPVFFWQSRRGLHGHPFKIIKFRTMSVMEDGSLVQQAKRFDSRVTRVGRWLRRTSIDELPQLINVLRGEMSLVGPRPHALAHDEYYGQLIDNYNGRQAVKPGITGWAQVNGARGETPEISDMRRRVEFDLWYVRRRSLTLDVKIIILTAIQVLRSPDAF
jgi:exopolysaccharide biosynthesis polyprenyl glycosylphosphotransferase